MPEHANNVLNVLNCQFYNQHDLQKFENIVQTKIVSEYDQELPQSQTADKTVILYASFDSKFVMFTDI